MIKLYIGNLSFDASEQELRDMLTSYEPIVEINRPSDRETGRPRGFAFVTFADRDTGEKALQELNGMEFMGRELRVDEAEERQAGRHPAERPRRVSMDIEVTKRVDDRPIGPDGKRVRYKSI